MYEAFVQEGPSGHHVHFRHFLVSQTGKFNIIILDRVKMNIALLRKLTTEHFDIEFVLIGSEGMVGMKVDNIKHILSRGLRPTRAMSTSRRINSMRERRQCKFPALVSGSSLISPHLLQVFLAIAFRLYIGRALSLAPVVESILFRPPACRFGQSGCVRGRSTSSVFGEGRKS